MSATSNTCSRCNARVDGTHVVCVHCGWCLTSVESMAASEAVADALTALVEPLREAWLHDVTVTVPSAGPAKQLFARTAAEEDRKVALAPHDAKAWVAKGNLHLIRSRWEDAQSSFDRALLLDSDLAAAWMGRGKALLGLGAYEGARHAFDTALASESGAIGALVYKSYALACLGELQQAQEAVEQAIAVAQPLLNAVADPTGKQALVNSLRMVFARTLQAHLLVAAQDCDSAIEAFAQAVLLDSKAAGAENNRLALLNYQGRGVEAQESGQAGKGAGAAAEMSTALPVAPMSRDLSRYGQQVTPRSHSVLVSHGSGLNTVVSAYLSCGY